MKIVQTEEHIALATEAPAIVIVFEAEAPMRALYPDDPDVIRRIALGIPVDWLEVLAKACGLDPEALGVEDG